jgi:hypothetical protein
LGITDSLDLTQLGVADTASIQVAVIATDGTDSSPELTASPDRAIPAVAWTRPNANPLAGGYAPAAPTVLLPAGSNGFVFAVGEGSPAKTRVGLFSAQSNSGNPLVYAITGGNIDGMFTIDSLGNISVAANLPVGTTAPYNLFVKAADMSCAWQAVGRHHG